MGTMREYRARICKLLGSPGIVSKELIPPAHVTMLPGGRTTTPVDCYFDSLAGEGVEVATLLEGRG
jgi:hypothetical protein